MRMENIAVITAVAIVVLGFASLLNPVVDYEIDSCDVDYQGDECIVTYGIKMFHTFPCNAKVFVDDKQLDLIGEDSFHINSNELTYFSLINHTGLSTSELTDAISIQFNGVSGIEKF